MVKLRLKRMGTKKRPFYRIVAMDIKAPRDGKAIDVLGHYNPIVHPAIVETDEEKVLYWLKKGAVPTDTVRSLFKRQGIFRRLQQEKEGSLEQDVLEAVDEEQLFDVEPLDEEEAVDVIEDEPTEDEPTEDEQE